MLQEDPPIAHCPLCFSDGPTRYANCRGSRYFHCAACDLVFLDPEQRLSHEAERARYDLHQNSPSDEAYRTFLDRLAAPLATCLSPHAKGLDFGCGPGPTLSVILNERGFDVANYDPYFFPDESLLERQYDFITSTEVLEHLYAPAKVIERLLTLLRPGGFLAIMTELRPEDDPQREKFLTWHYIREPSHVCFYSDVTMSWIGRRWELNIEAPHRNVRMYTR